MKPQSRAMLLALSRRGEAGVSAMDATCGQLPLPEREGEAEQSSFGLDDILGPVPTARELLDMVLFVIDEVPIEHQPDLATVEVWSDLTRRQVAAWAQAMAAVQIGIEPDGYVDVPPLPIQGEHLCCPVVSGASASGQDTYWQEPVWRCFRPPFASAHW